MMRASLPMRLDNGLPVAFEVTKMRDVASQWDGEGEDPYEQGLDCYLVTVTAYTVSASKLYRGRDYLGGVYLAPKEELGDVHGYLPQMQDMALAQLVLELKKEGQL